MGKKNEPCAKCLEKYKAITIEHGYVWEDYILNHPQKHNHLIDECVDVEMFDVISAFARRRIETFISCQETGGGREFPFGNPYVAFNADDMSAFIEFMHDVGHRYGVSSADLIVHIALHHGTMQMNSVQVFFAREHLSKFASV